MTKAFASAVVAAILLLTAASTMALGFGANTNFTALGQPLNYTVVLRLEPGEVVTQDCVVADVQVGDAIVPTGKIRALLTAGATPNERLVRISTSSLVDEPVIGVGVTVNCPTRIARRFVAFVDPPKKSAVGPTVAAAAALPHADAVALSPVSEVLQSAMSLTSGANRSTGGVVVAGESADGVSPRSVDTRRRTGSREAVNTGIRAAASAAPAATTSTTTAGIASSSGPAGVRADVAPATLNASLLPYVGSARNDRVSPDDTDSVAPTVAARAVDDASVKRSSKVERSKTTVASNEASTATTRPVSKLTRRQQLAAAKSAAKDARGTAAGSPRRVELASSGKAATATVVAVKPNNGSTAVAAKTGNGSATDKPALTAAPVVTNAAPAIAASMVAASPASLAASAAADARLAGDTVRALAAEMAAAQTATAARIQALEEALKRANQQNAQTQASLAGLRNEVAQHDVDSPGNLTMGLLVALSVALSLGLVVLMLRRRQFDPSTEREDEPTVAPADTSSKAIASRLLTAVGRTASSVRRPAPVDAEVIPVVKGEPAVDDDSVPAGLTAAGVESSVGSGHAASDEIEAPTRTPWWKLGRRGGSIASTAAALAAASTTSKIEPAIAAIDKPVKPDADQPPPATMREALSRAEMERKTTVPDTSAMAIAMRRAPSFDDESSTRRASSTRREMSVEELMDLEQQAEFFLVLGQDDAAVDLLTGHLRDGGGASAMPYLKLMDIHRRLRDETAYETVREEFNQRFNANAPAWDADPADGKELESYGELVARLQSLWGTPERALEVLEASLLRSHRMQADGEMTGKGEPDAGFDLPAYRDVLLLYTVARDLADQGAKAHAAGAPQAAATAGRWVGHVDSVDLLLPIGEPESADIDFGRTTAPAPLLATMPVETHPGVERALSLDVDISSFGSLDEEPPSLGATSAEVPDLPRDFDYPDTIDPNDPKDFGSRSKLLDADDMAALDFQLEFSLPAEPAPEPEPKPQSQSQSQTQKEGLKWIGGDPDGY